MNSLSRAWNRGGLLFGKMWEDSEVEKALAHQMVAKRGKCQILSVASSGDTSFALAALPEVKVEALDINPAQIWLCQLKQCILQELGAEALRGVLCQDARPLLQRLKPELPPNCAEFWEANGILLREGFHRAGRVDRMMNFWLWLFSQVVVPRTEIDRLLQSRDLGFQAQLVNEQWRGWKWNWGIKLAFWRPILRLIYGQELVARLPRDFGQQISERLFHFLTSFEAATNPYLWQTFASANLGGNRPPYLKDWGRVDFRQGTLEDLVSQEHQYDLFVLSNILEVADSQQCDSLLRAVRSLAYPGALVCLRFMAPRRRLWPELEYLEDESLRASQQDRAFFCNHFQIYRCH